MGKNGIHSGHRERLRKRFLETGTSGFREHELLELLLFYAFPRVNTNEISHRLIERFGSLDGVLNADREELLTVKGMGASGSGFIDFIGELCGMYADSAVSKTDFLAAGSAERYLVDYFSFSASGICLIISINSRLELADMFSYPTKLLIGGDITARDITETVIRNNIRRIIIGQSVERELPYPDEEDYLVTKLFSKILHTIGGEVCDHIICAGEKTFSMRKSGAFSFPEGGRRQ